MPKQLLLIITLVILTVGGAVVVAQEGDEAIDGDPTAGAAIYAEYCAACHTTQGEARAAHEAFATAISYSLFFEDVVAQGVETSDYMLAWGADEGGPLSEAQITDLSAYVQSWTSEEFDELHVRLNITQELTEEEAVGADLFFKNCAACHGLQGEGRDLNHFPAINPNIDVEAITRRGLVNAGMPPFAQAYAGPLDEAQIDSILLYIDTWEQPTDLQRVVEDMPKGLHLLLWIIAGGAVFVIGLSTLNIANFGKQ